MATYGAPLKFFQGVTQGDPLSPTIFNIVMEAVIQHCVTLVAGGVGEVHEGFVWSVQLLVDLFYTYDGLLASP